MSHMIYESVRQRLQRSELAVPGSSPKMFEKALNSPADYVFLDLEDDDETEAVMIIGEIGGPQEAKAAEYFQKHMSSRRLILLA